MTSLFIKIYPLNQILSLNKLIRYREDWKRKRIFWNRNIANFFTKFIWKLKNDFMRLFIFFFLSYSYRIFFLKAQISNWTPSAGFSGQISFAKKSFCSYCRSKVSESPVLSRFLKDRYSLLRGIELVRRRFGISATTP